MNRSALISECGKYRYRLERWWGEGPRVAWIMLNPSTADASVDDATIRRCVGFTKAWGFDGLVVVNVWPLRTPDPKELKRWEHTADLDELRLQAEVNGGHVGTAVREAALSIAAWGTHTPETTSYIQARIQGAGGVLHHLGLTKDGHPRHPLYVRGDTLPMPLEGTIE